MNSLAIINKDEGFILKAIKGIESASESIESNSKYT